MTENVMSSGESTEKILDLLYGDHTPEEQEELREALARSPNDQAELASFEETLSAFREAVPTEAMPTSAHAAIMAAARKQATQNLSKSTYATRPPRSNAPGPGVWSRLSIGPIAQIATVAALLLVGAVFMRQFGESAPDKFSEASTSVASEVRFDNFGTPPKTGRTPQGEALALADAPGEAQSEEAQEARGQEVEEGTLESLDQKQIASVERSYEPAPARQRRAAPRTTTRSAPSADNSIPRLPSSASAPAKKSSPRVESSIDFDDFGMGRASASPAPRPAAPATNTGDGTAPATSARAGAAGAIPPSPAAPAEAGAKAEREEAFADSAAQPSAMAQTETAYRNANYGEAIRQADAVLASGGSSATERARALDIKGQSLLAMGREAEADRVFATLESQHPDYRSERISGTREGIAQRRRAARRAADLEPEADDEGAAAMEAPVPVRASPPSKADEPQPQPTSY